MNIARYRRSTDAIHAAIGEDFVALQVKRGQCFGMENVTADVWKFLEDEPTLAEICDRLHEAYDVDEATCRADVERLLVLMTDEGLVEAVSSKNAPR